MSKSVAAVAAPMVKLQCLRFVGELSQNRIFAPILNATLTLHQAILIHINACYSMFNHNNITPFAQG